MSDEGCRRAVDVFFTAWPLGQGTAVTILASRGEAAA